MSNLSAIILSALKGFSGEEEFPAEPIRNPLLPKPLNRTDIAMIGLLESGYLDSKTSNALRECLRDRNKPSVSELIADTMRRCSLDKIMYLEEQGLSSDEIHEKLSDDDFVNELEREILNRKRTKQQ